MEKISGRVIVFDWGNTLVFDPFDDLKDQVAQKAAEVTQKTFNFTLNTQKFLEAWEKANNEVQYLYASHFSQEEPFIQIGLREAEVPASIAALLAPKILLIYRQDFKILLENDPRKNELRQTLEEFKKRGKRLGVLSNDRSFTARATLAWMQVADLFDHFLPSEDTKVEKPDPKVFDVVSERFGAPKEEIIYVGDDPVRDIECAHRAGVKSVLYIPPKKYQTVKSWRFYNVQPEKHYTQVENFRDLLKVIS